MSGQVMVSQFAQGYRFVADSGGWKPVCFPTAKPTELVYGFFMVCFHSVNLLLLSSLTFYRLN